LLLAVGSVVAAQGLRASTADLSELWSSVPVEEVKPNSKAVKKGAKMELSPNEQALVGVFLPGFGETPAGGTTKGQDAQETAGQEDELEPLDTDGGDAQDVTADGEEAQETSGQADEIEPLDSEAAETAGDDDQDLEIETAGQLDENELQDTAGGPAEEVPLNKLKTADHEAGEIEVAVTKEQSVAPGAMSASDLATAIEIAALQAPLQKKPAIKKARVKAKVGVQAAKAAVVPVSVPQVLPVVSVSSSLPAAKPAADLSGLDDLFRLPGVPKASPVVSVPVTVSTAVPLVSGTSTIPVVKPAAKVVPGVSATSTVPVVKPAAKVVPGVSATSTVPIVKPAALPVSVPQASPAVSVPGTVLAAQPEADWKGVAGIFGPAPAPGTGLVSLSVPQTVPAASVPVTTATAVVSTEAVTVQKQALEALAVDTAAPDVKVEAKKASVASMAKDGGIIVGTTVTVFTFITMLQAIILSIWK